jgi:outer membrane biogenesis lipoprotein LolB
MKKFMNAFFALTTAAIISFVFAGCTQQAEQPAKTAPSSVEQAEQAEQPAKTAPSSVEQAEQAEQPAKTEHSAVEHPK